MTNAWFVFYSSRSAVEMSQASDSEKILDRIQNQRGVNGLIVVNADGKRWFKAKILAAVNPYNHENVSFVML